MIGWPIWSSKKFRSCCANYQIVLLQGRCFSCRSLVQSSFVETQLLELLLTQFSFSMQEYTFSQLNKGEGKWSVENLKMESHGICKCVWAFESFTSFFNPVFHYILKCPFQYLNLYFEMNFSKYDKRYRIQIKKFIKQMSCV